MPTRRFGLTLNQQFEATDNQAREADSAGVTYSSTTRLGFTAVTRNPLNQLDFSTSTALRFSDRPEQETISDIDSPRLNLRYQRSGATSTFTASANFREDDIDFLRPLDDFIDEDGELDIPDDIDSLNASGTRRTYNSNFSLSLLRDAPVSLTFNLGFNGRDYSDVTDPDLFDTQTVRYGVTAGFRLGPEFNGRLSVSESQFEAENEEQTERDRRRITFGVDKALSKVLTGRASIGRTEIDTTTTDGTTRTTGTNASAGLSLARPNGSIGFDVSTTANTNGDRQRMSLQRSLDLPNATLTGRLGLTRLEEGNSDTTAGIRYSQTLPNGSMSFSFNRAVRFVEEDGNDQEFLSASASHTYDINELSSVSFRGAVSQNENSDRTTLSVNYRYALTADWDLTSGYSFSTLEDGGSQADTHRVFVGFSRRFDLPF